MAESSQTLLVVLIVVALLNLVAIAWLLLRPSTAVAEAVRRVVDEDLRKGREEAASAAQRLREENAETARVLRTEVTQAITTLGGSITTNVEAVRTTLDMRVRELQQQNEKKLEEMRRTVDEKLQGTLERRLGESFKLVSERLERVQRGLGEMQELATGVGDLKRVLTNVKARGTWAEVQLGSILEQFLAPGQFERNVRVRPDRNEIVEFAVRLPGPGADGPTSAPVWLPIDSKFPQEDYLRLHEAAEQGDAEAVKRASDALARALRTEAARIADKYLHPPATTDFGILFLATEGLYAEAIRQPGLAHDIQQKHKVLLAGPTTLAALLNSLRMGFQTLAIQQRASEVWDVLSAVKTEFNKFGDVLDRLKKQLNTASNTIDQAQTRTRAMQRRLTKVEQLPETETQELLGLEAGDGFAELGSVEWAAEDDEADDEADA